jgi:hypothetical protein
MSLGVTYNQNLIKGVDVASLKEVTQQIFQRANKTTELSSLDLSKFNRVTLGADLYSGKVNSATARQISMTNSGIQINLNEKTINSLNYLSSEASKSIFKNIDGKITIAETKEITERKNSIGLPSFGQLMKTADLDSDKKGSNPFYKGELLKISKNEEKEDSLNIFA